MERNEAIMKTGYSKILWAIMAVMLCAVPCSAVTVDGSNSPYLLNTELYDFIEVAGTDSQDGPGILELMPGGYALFIYVNEGGTLNIYGSHPSDFDVEVALSANVKLFTDSTGSIVLETTSGPDAELVGTTITVDIDAGWTGKLTWNYEGTTYSLNISTLSDIAIEVVGVPPEPEPITVQIDIKPGSYPNAINLGSNGVIPVAILSTPDFDATTAINPENVFLAGASVAVRGKGNKLLSSNEDVNGDSLLDLVIKVETENLDPGTFQDGTAILEVREIPEDPTSVIFQGSDSIIIVPAE